MGGMHPSNRNSFRFKVIIFFTYWLNSTCNLWLRATSCFEADLNHFLVKMQCRFEAQALETLNASAFVSIAHRSRAQALAAIMFPAFL